MIAVVLIHRSHPWCYIVLEPGDWHFLPTAGYNHDSENLDTLGSCWWKSAVTLTLSAEAWQVGTTTIPSTVIPPDHGWLTAAYM